MQQDSYAPHTNIPMFLSQPDIKTEDEPTIQVHRYRLCKDITRSRPDNDAIIRHNQLLISKPRVTMLKLQDKERKGRWTLAEENLYWSFVLNSKSIHPQWQETRTHKKRVGYFVEMSNFIKTRSPGQCRSHDQKIRKRMAAGEAVVGVRKYREEKQEMEEESPSSESKSTSDESLVQYRDYKDIDAHSFLNSQQDYNFEMESELSMQTFFEKLKWMLDSDTVKQEDILLVKEEIKVCQDEVKMEEMPSSTMTTKLTMIMKLLEEKLAEIERSLVKAE